MTDAATHPDQPASALELAGVGFVSGLLAASVVKSPSGMRDQLDQAVLAVGLGNCVDNVLLPAMRQIGTRWQHGLLDIETERLTTETVRGWLEKVALRAPQPDPIPPLVLACGPAERHSIGLEALCLLLRYQRRPCRLLGPRTSIHAITTAINANKSSGVIIVAHRHASRLGATQSLLAAAALGADLFYAGDAFAATNLRSDIPGTYLGTNIQAACAAIIEATSRPSQ